MKTSWTTYTNYVDIDTGERLPKEVALEHYTIINRTKFTKQIKLYGKDKQFKGYKMVTEWNAECRKRNNVQLKLELK